MRWNVLSGQCVPGGWLLGIRGHGIVETEHFALEGSQIDLDR